MHMSHAHVHAHAHVHFPKKPFFCLRNCIQRVSLRNVLMKSKSRVKEQSVIEYPNYDPFNLLDILALFM